MIIFLTIFQYLVQATVDLMDKFLLTARKVEPVSYTFYTVVTGAVLVVAWPWVFAPLPLEFVFLNLLSGAYFALAGYIFFKALSQGEVSRTVPFIFGLVPVFDIFISALTGRNALIPTQLAAICLLIPGALIVSHHKGDDWLKHAGVKVLSAFLFSSYYALWQFSSQHGPVLNSLIWNRVGGAGILLLLLFYPTFRRKVFATQQVKQKGSTSVIFLFKQIVGGANFIFLSFLYSLGTISVINALQGFRYVFLLLFSAFLSKKRRHLIEEDIGSGMLWQKGFGIALIFAGTIFLFI